MRFATLVLSTLILPGFLSACGRDAEVEQPRPLYGEVPIEYPLELWDEGVEGQTILRVRVNEVGEVDRAEIAQSSGHAALDSAALNGAKELRFTPGMKNGKRVEVWAQVPVHFSRKSRR